ncbi:hypothetical protein HELRODRAFT_81881, partial [Helobdella robusta]|uniref:G-protein coupled receptors family 1 profile domain-containing protein n=1 Tax=Helobdella robusta TaxID=6412 RepID=T1G4K2_HELRO
MSQHSHNNHNGYNSNNLRNNTTSLSIFTSARHNDTTIATTSTTAAAASSNNSHNSNDFAYPDWQLTFIFLICGLIILITILGNILVCTAVAIVRKLRTPSNLLIVSLAVSDLLVALLVMPFALVYEAKGCWIFGQTACDVWTSLDVFLCTASILNLCVISVDRYFVITRPFQYAMKRTPLRMTCMIVFVWLLSALISIPPMFGWKEDPKKDHCNITQNIGYQFYATIGAFYLPLLVMVTIYYRIYRVSSRIAEAEARSKPNNCQLQQPHQSHSNSLSLTPSRQQSQSQQSQQSSNLSKECKATKTLGVIMGTFIACWLPFFILALIKPFCHSSDACIPHWLNALFLWLGYANSFLNPIIYARFNREFRKPFREILLFRCLGINRRLRFDTYAEQYGPTSQDRL